MCLHISEQETIIIFGILTSIVITCLSIYQFIQLSNDRETRALLFIIQSWIVSKILSLTSLKCRTKFEDLILYLIGLAFQCEWYFNKDSIQSAYNKLIKQLLFIILPTVVVNIYLLSDVNRDITHSYYIVIIFISFTLLWLNIIFSVMDYQKPEPEGNYNRFFSMFSNFCFYYLFVQTLLYEKYICIGLMIFNAIIGAIDIWVSNDQKYREDWLQGIQTIIFSYIFQININNFSAYSKNCRNYQLQSWMNILRLSIQLVNIAVLFITKLLLYPLIIEMDKAFYAFFVLSIPQFYLFGINLYYKLIKTQKVSTQFCLSTDKFLIKDKLYQTLKDRFTLEFELDVIIKVDDPKEFNEQQFGQNLKTLQQLMIFTQQKSKNKTSIKIYNYDQSFQVGVKLNNFNCIQEQFIQISDQFFSNKLNIDLLSCFRLILIQNRVLNTNFICPTFKFDEVKNLLLSTQQFNINEFKINEDTHLYIYEQLLNIIKNNYQVLAFYKHIQQFIPINPTLLLFDLYEY